MKDTVLFTLWGILLCGITLSALGIAVRRILYARHDRLCRSWAALCQQNQELCGHPGPIDLEDYPGMPETKKDMEVFDRMWFALMVTTAADGALMSAILTTGTSATAA